MTASIRCIVRQALRTLVLCGLGLGSLGLGAAVTCGPGGRCAQTLRLNPGWNAVYVQVDPEPRTTAEVFAAVLDAAGPRVASVWTWLARPTRIEFLRDQTTEDLLRQPGWLRFFPPGSAQAFLTNLSTIPGNRAYLVKLDGGEATDLVITGRALPPGADWQPDSFNFTGFHVDEAQPPSFRDFVAASPAHAGQPVYGLSADGATWQALNPLTSLIESGHAYWVWCNGGSDYLGPVDITEGRSLGYGRRSESLPVQIRNRTTTTRTLSLGILADGQPVRYQNPDPAAGQRWLALPLNTSVAPGDAKRLWIGIRRRELRADPYGDTLEVRVPGLTRWLIPVTASASAPTVAPRAAVTQGATAAALATVPPTGPLTGLWVGTVTIDRVSQPNGDDPTAPDPTPVDAPFGFRILLHLDQAGQVRLLKDVVLMGRAGVADQPGRAVLLTDDSLIPRFTGVALRDGTAVGKRISTLAYDFPGESLAMQGTLGGQLTVAIPLPATTATNPFRHRYHPQHDNLTPDYQRPADEVYAITRTLTLTFDTGDDGSLGAGYAALAGTYSEVVTGLHKHPIQGTGRFALRNAAATAVLNDSSD